MSSRLDFGPFRRNYFLLSTTVLGTLAWLFAFTFQIIATAQFGGRPIGILWFGIFLQAFLNFNVILSTATNSIPAMRAQLSLISGIGIIFAIQGVDAGFFPAPRPIGPGPDAQPALTATGVGYFLLALVDILWLLYFTCNEDDRCWTTRVFAKLGVTSGGAVSDRPPRSSLQFLPVELEKAELTFGEEGTSNAMAMPQRVNLSFPQRASAVAKSTVVAAHASVNNPGPRVVADSASSAAPRSESRVSQNDSDLDEISLPDPHPPSLTPPETFIRTPAPARSLPSLKVKFADLPPPSPPPFLPLPPPPSGSRSPSPLSSPTPRPLPSTRSPPGLGVPASLIPGLGLPATPRAHGPAGPRRPPPLKLVEDAAEPAQVSGPDAINGPALESGSGLDATKAGATIPARRSSSLLPSASALRANVSAKLKSKPSTRAQKSPKAPARGGAEAPTAAQPSDDATPGPTMKFVPRRATMRARAIHTYIASPEDPNELSFTKGETLEIVDTEGKWWRAKKADGEPGIVPSNYIEMI